MVGRLQDGAEQQAQLQARLVEAIQHMGERGAVATAHVQTATEQQLQLQRARAVFADRLNERTPR